MLIKLIIVVAISVVFLGVGFYFAYRGKKVNEQIAEEERKKNNK